MAIEWLMRKEEAVNFYGSQSALARALGIAQASVAGWGEYPPGVRQLQLEALTGGTLKAEPKWTLQPEKKAD